MKKLIINIYINNVEEAVDALNDIAVQIKEGKVRGIGWRFNGEE